MDRITQKDIDWLLQPGNGFKTDTSHLRRTPAQPTSAQKKSRSGQLIAYSAMIIVSLIAPFLILIRLSVYLIQVEQWNGWIALGAGAGVTFLFVLIVFLLLFRKFAGRSWVIKSLVAVSLIMVTGFCIYGLSYLSGVHAKTDQVRDVYRSLHPVLRVAVASVTLADQSLIITDIQRTPDDYKKMGLSPLQSSLHYIQPTGFVHAIDLRTIGHSELRNKTLEFTLKVMGFSTLRHVGTADHLHISLPIK